MVRTSQERLLMSFLSLNRCFPLEKKSESPQFLSYHDMGQTISTKLGGSQTGVGMMKMKVRMLDLRL